MCGIAGIINIQNEESYQAVALHHMTDNMVHRGPDDEGFVLFRDNLAANYFGDETPEWSSRNVADIPGYPTEHIKKASHKKSAAALGHRRLSIVDLSSHGHQPMATADLRFWIVFNGEVYNFREIAQELQRNGVQLRGNSDTEVILYSYVLWGKACLTRFNGMFAFAIWDAKEKSLFCARDRIGIKPFYYTIVDGQFVFASDIKTLIASGLYVPEVDPEGLYLAMAFGIAPRPKTAFSNVSALEQAHWMRVNSDGVIKKERYWAIPVGTQNHKMSEHDAVELLEEQLIASIKYRLAADVPVGVFMSGGIDSTTISSIASELHPGIKAFTLAYEDNVPELDEAAQARATAAMHPMQHIVYEVHPAELLVDLDRWIDGYEEPFYSLAANFVISRVVKENNVTVILNGLGGDELFAGYSYYRWAGRWPTIKHLKGLPTLLGPLRSRRKIDRLCQLLATESVNHLHTVLFLKNTDSELHQLFTAPPLKQLNTIDFVHELYVGDAIEFEDAVEAMSYMDLMNYIGNHHVHRVDQFTMAHSIEGRFPFLDHHVIQAAFSIPSQYKLHGRIQKYVLRKVARKYIAPECLSMKKKGFGLPLKQWIQGPLLGMVRQKLTRLAEREMFSKQYIELCFNEYEQGRKSATHIWHLVALELWYERFIEKGNWQ